MIIRLEDSFTKLAQQLGKPFSEAEKHQLAELISERKTYDQLRFIISDQEREKEQSKSTVIELGNIGKRYFALNIYYNVDQIQDNIPLSIRELLTTISPVQIDVMTNMRQTNSDNNDTRQNYMKVGEVYDEGDVHAHYVNEVIQEDSGIVPMDDI